MSVMRGLDWIQRKERFSMILHTLWRARSIERRRPSDREQEAVLLPENCEQDRLQRRILGKNRVNEDGSWIYGGGEGARG